MKEWKAIAAMVLAMGLAWVSTAEATPTYSAGVSGPCTGCIFGTHLAESATGSVAGVGGSGINSAAGSALDGSRTYIYDMGGWIDGTVTRGDADFAMMVWDLGVGNALNTVRLYTHQDHYSGGLITTNFFGQDVMEYSVWGSNDNVTFALLSDVVGFDLNGGGAGIPTYTFSGTEPSVIYRGGSTEFGILNAYTRDYTFGAAYRYYGIRSSSVSLDYCDGTASSPGRPAAGCIDADPEIDTVAFHRGPISTPEPASLSLLGIGVAFLAGFSVSRRRVS